MTLPIRVYYPFTITLNGETEKDVTAQYTLEDSASNSATNGTDYASAVSDVIIMAGDTSGTFTVDLIGDTLDEENETFLVKLASTSTNANSSCY